MVKAIAARPKVFICLLYYFAVTVSAGFGKLNFLVRGSEESGISNGLNSDDVPGAEERIAQFLHDESQSATGKFHVQGWRWHTLSMIREMKRLERLSRRLGSSPSQVEAISALEKASEYVIGFNMKGLHNIERDLFFPWIREKSKLLDDSTVVRAISILMDQLENDRRTIEKMGSSIITQVKQARKDPAKEREAYYSVADSSSLIIKHALAMQRREEELLVPMVAKLVPEAEQKSFNNKVIRMLGIFDSRMHLVGMHEAVWELNDQKERDLFQEAIPSVPRMMIPRWKRLLYQPKTEVLDVA